METNETCRWCIPDENGQYSAAEFRNPNGQQRIVLFFNGAEASLTMETEGDSTTHYMRTPINYCPMCGRRVRTEAVE